MTQLVLVLLAGAWIVVLAPDVARLFRPRRRAASSVDRFRKQLDSLGRSAPAAVNAAPRQRLGAGGASFAEAGRRRGGPTATIPTTPQQAATRRRDIASLLVLCTLAALAGTLATGSLWALSAFVCLLGLTLGFGALVVRRRRALPIAQVHYLQQHQECAPATVRVVQRQASG